MHSYTARFIILAILNFICHLGLWKISTNWWLLDSVSTFYMPVGLRLGLLLVLPYKYWPAVILSDVSVYVTLNYAHGLAIKNIPFEIYELFCAHTLAFYIPLFIVRTVTSKHIHDGWLTDTKAVVSFFIAVLANQLGNALDGVRYLKIATNDELIIKITSLFAGGWVGIILVAPVVISFLYWQKKGFILSKILITRLFVPACFITCTFALMTIKYPDTIYLFRAISFIPLLYFCYKFGWVGGVIISFLLNSYLLITNLYLNHSAPTTEQLFYLFGFSITSLLVGAAISEQKQAYDQLNDKAKALNKSNQKNLELAKKVINIQENERRRLSQELHDEVGQNLVALQMEVKILENKYEVLKKEQATVSIREKYAQIYQSIYNMLHWLRPRIIDDIGLFKSLTSKYFQTPLNKVNIQYIPKISPHVDTLPDKLTIAIFRIIQESVTNAIKHSSASEFTVKLSVENNIQLTIFDNGVGFSNLIKSTNSLSGFGLQGIKDRVISLGGSYNFNSSNGFKLEILLPFN